MANNTKKKMTVVGIGASAGGLKALKTFFKHVSDSPGVSFVVVMHLSPEHESHLAHLLQPHCPIPVEQVNENTPLKLNRVYVIPPNSNLESVDTHLRLTKLESKRSQRAPIDHFFRTLADTYDGHSVGILLSGTGSDGTQGLRKINECRGLSLVQLPEEADFDGMPRSAISSGSADEILLVSEMPAAIQRFMNTVPDISVIKDGESLTGDCDHQMRELFSLIRIQTGHDFSNYKQSTLQRRIERRMQMRNVDQLADYVDMLKGRKEEVYHLFDDLLITVTEFFRDEEVFDHLRDHVLPEFFEKIDTTDQIRVWSVGCSTGEEAYSLAMLLVEESERQKKRPQLQVFATDLQEKALTVAREGIYPDTISANIPDERLNRFFDQENGSYQIKRELREMVVFAEHNVLRDPPFSRLDMVVCRNMLIYLQKEIQQEVMSILHYALKPGGMLLLGCSESVDPSDLFVAKNKPHSLFQRRNIPAGGGQLTVYPFSPKRTPVGEPANRERSAPQSYGSMHADMVEQYAPPSVLISQNHDVVHSSVKAGRYLHLPGGEPTRNIFKLVNDTLRVELHAILHAASENPGQSQSKKIPLELDGEQREVILKVRTADEGPLDGFYLLMFEESPLDPEKRESASHESAASLEELQAELDYSKQRLQAVVEQYESGQEEMQASNEEMQSTNEELRSTMEELETSKEELQSMNEELTTLNQENKHRVDELKQLSGDLQNLLAASEIATLFLDRDVRIVRFTPKVGELFNVRNSDKGRPLSDLTHRLGDLDLHREALGVLDSLKSVERELQSDDGKWYLCRLLPYRTPNSGVEGLVVTLIDITERKLYEQQTHAAREYAEAVVESLPEPLTVLQPDFTIKTLNASFCELFHLDRRQAEGLGFFEVNQGQWDLPELRDLLEEVLPENHAFYGYQIELDLQAFGKRVLLVNARQVHPLRLILLGIQDITDRDNSQRVLAQRNAKMEEQKFRLQHLAKELASAEHRERKRLASMLHDELQQYLVALQLHLNSAKAESQTSGVDECLAKAQDVLKMAIQSSRDLTRQLRPPVLYEAGLVPALRWQAGEMKRLHEISIQVESDIESCPLDDDLRAMVYESVRELLLNVVKHANVSEAFVKVQINDQSLHIEIADHGIGFDTESVDGEKLQNGSMGLFSIRERLKAVNGTLKITSIPGDGTVIKLQVSLIQGRPAMIQTEPEGIRENFEGGQVAPTVRSTDSTRVMVVDDHAVVRQGLVTLINRDPRIEVIGQAEDGVQALALTEKLQPDVVLLDINMPRMNGLDAIKAIRKRWPHIHVIGLSVQDDDVTVETVKNAGASLFLSKSDKANTIVEAILDFQGS